MDSTQGEKRTAAFELLRQEVSRRYEGGRSCTASAIKAALVKHASGFSEKDLGFPAFRHFLREAADRGHVALAERESDLLVHPVGRPVDSAISPLPRVSLRRGSRRLRRDLWRCFVDWDANWIRFYDPRADQAYMLPSAPSRLESKADAQVRCERESSPDRFIDIDPIPARDQIEWMREFAGSVSGEAKSALEEALGGDRPPQEFARVLRETPGLQKKWRARFAERVGRRMAEWVRDRDLTVDLYESQQKMVHAAKRSPASYEREVREAVLGAVQRMPLAALLDLVLPVEYVIPRRTQD